MPRDLQIRRAFELADDAMQGLIGFYLYAKACGEKVQPQELISALPQEHIPITHNWLRSYRPSDLCNAMERYFEPYLARVALIAVIAAFEGALARIGDRLLATRKIPKALPWSYKKKLEWAFSVVNQSTYGDQSMQARIPMLCLDVDHARRIRNLWMHNNGLFDASYIRDSIHIPGHRPMLDSLFVEEFQRKRKRIVPVVLSSNGFFRLTKSHIELIHHLHDTLQKAYFRQSRPYAYRQLRKRIEWHRLLVGN